MVWVWEPEWVLGERRPLNKLEAGEGLAHFSWSKI